MKTKITVRHVVLRLESGSSGQPRLSPQEEVQAVVTMLQALVCREPSLLGVEIDVSEAETSTEVWSSTEIEGARPLAPLPLLNLDDLPADG